MRTYQAKDVIKLHGFDIGLDKDAVSLPILKQMLKGWYEDKELQIMAALLKNGDRMLEMGAATGITSMWAAKLIGAENIFPYELNPYLVDWAHDNFARNDLDIRVHQSALAANKQALATKIDFHIHEDFWASSLVKPEGPHETIQVTTASFEQAIADRQANVLLIDIEGGEVDLLMKADISGIEKIIMEIHYDAVGKIKTNAMIQHLTNQGFFLDLSLSAKSVVALYRT